MILINLLPHREAARKKRKEQFFAFLGFSALIGFLIAFLWSQLLSNDIAHQLDRNNFLNQEIKKLEEQIKDIAGLQTEITALKARQQAVEDLQADRNLPVYILSELVTHVPSGVYLTSLKQNGLSLTVTGVAQSQERVSELLRNFSEKSQWLQKPDLKEIVSTSISLNPKDQRRVSNFQLNLLIVRQKETKEMKESK